MGRKKMFQLTPKGEEIKNYFSQNEIKALEQIYKEGEKSYEEDELLTVGEAYEYLRNNGYNISFRAFGGRIERGRIKTIKKGRRRFIPLSELKKILEIANNFYTISEAYDIYSKYDPSINFRAFIGRVEKGTIPSVKIGGSRLIPKKVVEGLINLAKNYYSVSQAIEELKKNGIKIKRNAFERRLDRGRIPFIKIGGKRYIHKDIIKELINIEKSKKTV